MNVIKIKIAKKTFLLWMNVTKIKIAKEMFYLFKCKFYLYYFGCCLLQFYWFKVASSKLLNECLVLLYLFTVV